jgi:hypothetical protein
MAVCVLEADIGNVGIGIDRQNTVVIGIGLAIKESSVLFEAIWFGKGTEPVESFFPDAHVLIDDRSDDQLIKAQFVAMTFDISEHVGLNGSSGLHSRETYTLYEVPQERQRSWLKGILRRLK